MDVGYRKHEKIRRDRVEIRDKEKEVVRRFPESQVKVTRRGRGPGGPVNVGGVRGGCV